MRGEQRLQRSLWWEMRLERQAGPVMRNLDEEQ